MKIPHLRWWIAGLLFLASVLNYVDRQALSLLAPTIQADLQLSHEDYAFLVNLFLVAYTLSLLVTGRIVDRLGVRFAFALFVGWWSISNLLTGFARSLGSLGTCRFLLGLGEGGNWTAAPKVVALWFPARERGIAIGIYTLGATIGATLAPVLIVGLAARYGWPGAFVITGGAGLVWIGPWLWLYRGTPQEHPRITERERALLAPAPDAAPLPPAAGDAWWRTVARREVGLLLLARLLTDPVWYFYQFWFAKYLHEYRGLDQAGLMVTWVIFLAADLGALGGGWFSGRLIQRRRTPPESRLLVMLAAAALVPFSALVPHVPPIWLALGCGMLAVFAHMTWLINLSALVVDLVPPRHLATTFGVIAAGSSLGGMTMNWAVGRLVGNYSYAPAFLALAAAHPLAILLLWRLRRAPPAAASS